MNVLVVGGGAREHALAWKLAQSPRVGRLYCAPGNAGTAQIAENVPIPATDVHALAAWAEERRIDLAVVGPEDPLIAGVVDAFQARGLVAFGPTASAARIEGSKSWAKELMARCGVPTARSVPFDSPDAARAHVLQQQPPIVVKADGLAAGKGVTIARTREEALDAVADCMERGAFGAAGRRVLIEECLTGTEVSILALVDGERAVPLIPACDYKRVFDGDLGPNTGGMGSYAPPGFVSPELRRRICTTILDPIVAGLAADGSKDRPEPCRSGSCSSASSPVTPGRAAPVAHSRLRRACRFSTADRSKSVPWRPTTRLFTTVTSFGTKGRAGVGLRARMPAPAQLTTVLWAIRLPSVAT